MDRKDTDGIRLRLETQLIFVRGVFAIVICVRNQTTKEDGKACYSKWPGRTAKQKKFVTRLSPSVSRFRVIAPILWNNSAGQ